MAVSPRRGFTRAAVALLCVTTIDLSFFVRPAFADCATEETRFVIQNAAGEYAYGSTNVINVKDHDIAGCGGGFNFFATSHLRNSTGDKWVEVGYTDTVNGLGQEIWQIFIEGGINGNNATCGPSFSYLISPGRDDKFRVTNVPGTNNFNLYVDYGSGWVSIGSCTNTFSHGWAYGETGRYGGTATGAGDDHKSLQYKDSSGTWKNWADNHEAACGNPCLSNWHYDWCSTTRYQVFRDGSGNSC